MILLVAAVDDWNTGSLRHLQQIRITQQPRHDAINIAGQILEFIELCRLRRSLWFANQCIMRGRPAES